MMVKLDDGNSLLHYSVFHDLVDLVSYLIDKKAEINVKNNFGDTPLHYAMQNNNKEVVLNRSQIIQLLLDNGADLKIKNNHNKTPYDMAEVCNTLKEARYKENVSIRKQNGQQIQVKTL